MNSKAVKFTLGTVAVLAIIAFSSLSSRAAMTVSQDQLLKGVNTVDNGGVLDVKGTLKISGTTVTATADQLNQAGSKASLGVSNVTAQTASVAGTVTPQTATVTVTLTPQTCLATNSAGDEVAVWTNCTASFTGLTNVTVSTAGVCTNVSVSR